MFVFVFDPEPGGTGPPAPHSAAARTNSVCEGLRGDVDFKGSILTFVLLLSHTHEEQTHIKTAPFISS